MKSIRRWFLSGALRQISSVSRDEYVNGYMLFLFPLINISFEILYYERDGAQLKRNCSVFSNSVLLILDFTIHFLNIFLITRKCASIYFLTLVSK
jgi:hypothetical protein